MPSTFPAALSLEKFITHDYPKALITEKLVDIKARINARPNYFDKFEYMYFVNAQNKLVGVISIVKLLELPDNVLLSKFLFLDIKFCYSNNSIEEAVHKALHYELAVLPVLDKNMYMVGIIPTRTLLRMTAKLLEFRGYRHSGFVHKDNLYNLAIKGSVLNLVFARIPWLLIGSVGGLLAAQYVGIFEATLEKNIILAFFIPTIVYMSDAVGTQTETLFIRTIALAEKTKLVVYFLKDVAVASCLGMIIGLFLAGMVFIWKRDWQISLILGLAMFLNITVASPIALTIPVILRKLGKDPALGSGPLATIIQDVASLIIYFSVVMLVLRFL
jgi:magnesium transporter